jgi:hypothetical protein
VQVLHSDLYFFPANALTTPGIYDTNPGINVNVGKLEVAAPTPEPSTSVLMLAGLSLVALRVCRRLRGTGSANRGSRA